MAEIQGVAGARVVHVMAPVIGLQPVVGHVVDPAHAQRGAELVAFGGMVVDHVEDHLDTGLMQMRDHFLEFADLATGEIAGVRGEEGDAVVAPVVAHAFFQQMLVIQETMHGEQFEAGHTEVAQVLEQFAVHQPGAGSAHPVRYRGVAHADAAQVGFVDDGFVPGHAIELLLAPGERRVDDPGLGHERRAVPRIETQVGIRGADGVAEQRFRPAQFADQLPGIGIDQQLVGIEAVPGVGFVGAIDPVSVDLPRMRIRQVAMPDFVAVLRQLDALLFPLAAGIEQAQLHAGGMGREQREVHSQAVPCRTQRKRTPLGNAGMWSSAHR
ncbi:hypothetical protein D3C76_817650 [compost metagenome]